MEKEAAGLRLTSNPPRRRENASAKTGFCSFWTLVVTRPLVGVASPRATAASAWAAPRPDEAVAAHYGSVGCLSASALPAALPLAQSTLQTALTSTRSP